jgi:hypothetical protein
MHTHTHEHTQVWNSNTGELYHTLRGHATEIVCLSFNPQVFVFLLCLISLVCLVSVCPSLFSRSNTHTHTHTHTVFLSISLSFSLYLEHIYSGVCSLSISKKIKIHTPLLRRVHVRVSRSRVRHKERDTQQCLERGTSSLTQKDVCAGDDHRDGVDGQHSQALGCRNRNRSSYVIVVCGHV